MKIDPNWLGMNAVSIGVPDDNLTAIRVQFPWQVWTCQEDFFTTMILAAQFYPLGETRTDFKKLCRALDWKEGSIEYDRLNSLLHTVDVIRFHREIPE